MSIKFTFGQVKGLSRIADENDSRYYPVKYYVGCVHITQDGYAIVSNAVELLKVKITGDVPDKDTLGAGLKIEKLVQCAAIAKASKTANVSFDVTQDNVKFGQYPPYIEAAYPDDKCTNLVAQYELDSLINVLTAMKDALGAKKGQSIIQLSMERGDGLLRPTLLRACTKSGDAEVEGLIAPCRNNNKGE